MCHGVFMQVIEEGVPGIYSMYEDDLIIEMLKLGEDRCIGIDSVWAIYETYRLKFNQVIYNNSAELDSIIPRGVADYIKRHGWGKGRAGSQQHT